LLQKYRVDNSSRVFEVIELQKYFKRENVPFSYANHTENSVIWSVQQIYNKITQLIYIGISGIMLLNRSKFSCLWSTYFS